MHPRVAAQLILSLAIMISFLPVSAQAAATAQEQEQENATAPAAEKRRPAPKTQEEYIAFQSFLREKDPDKQISLAEDFLLEYPDTELKEYAFQAAAQAYQAKNDYAQLLTYGELTLAENEDNLTALLILSAAIPERTSKSDPDAEEYLAAAEQYAQRALELIAQMPKTATSTPEEWERTKRDAEATPHAALGLIAMMREDFWKAERQFRLATDLVTRPDPIALYRLGLCYSFQKRYDLALEALERSNAVGGVKITGADGRARDLVAEAREFALKAKAALEPPGSTVMPPEEPETPPAEPESETL